MLIARLYLYFLIDSINFVLAISLTNDNAKLQTAKYREIQDNVYN